MDFAASAVSRPWYGSASMSKAMSRSAWLFLAVSLLFFISFPLQAASDKNIWLSSQRGNSDLDKMSSPNLAIGLEPNETRSHIARLLTIEVGGLYLRTDTAGVSLETQTVDVSSRFNVTLRPSQTGLPNNLYVSGSVTFSVALSFSGTAFHFLPRVESVVIESIDGVVLTPAIEAALPDWLQDAIVAYLQARDMLQLPVHLGQDFNLAANFKPTSQTPAGALRLSNAALRAEFWINAAAVLIDQRGIIGLAEARFDLTLPLCSTVSRTPPVIKNMRFTEFNSNRVISEIGSQVAAVDIHAEATPNTLTYELTWRLNGVTISTHPVATDQNGAFVVSLATVAKGYGIYTAVLTAHGKQNVDDREEMRLCVAAALDIIKLQELSLVVPDPLTHAAALAAYQNYFNRFRASMTGRGLLFQLDRLYLQLAKPTISEILIRTFNALNLSGTLDPSIIPAIHLADAKIKVPDADTISCSPTRACSSSRQCNLQPCPFNEDQRSCHRDTWLGGYNDPWCEGEKATENIRRRALQGRCMADAALVKLDCERLKKQENMTCELEKAAEKALCETLKSTVRLMTPDGNLATVNADFKFGGSVAFSFQRLYLGAQLDTFTLSLGLSGVINTHADIEFIPNNLGGHILGCLSKWKAPIDISTGPKSPGPLSINGQIAFRPNSEINFNFLLPSIEINMTPPFIALFANNPHLAPLCPVLFTAGVGVGIYGLLRPEFQNTLWTGDYKIDPIELDLTTKIPGVEIPGRFGWPPVTLTMGSTPGSIIWQ